MQNSVTAKIQLPCSELSSNNKPRQCVKKQRHHFANKGPYSQGYVFFPVVMYGRESWTIKKAEHWRTDAFKLWCWRRLLRFPWKVRRSNQPTLKEINPECSLEGLMLKLKLQYLGCLMRTVDSLEKTLMLGKIEGRRRRGWQRMRYLDGITDQWTWTWANSGRWWGTEKPGVLQSMVSGRVGHDLATEQQQKLLSAVQVVLSVCNTKY